MRRETPHGCKACAVRHCVEHTAGFLITSAGYTPRAQLQGDAHSFISQHFSATRYYELTIPSTRAITSKVRGDYLKGISHEEWQKQQQFRQRLIPRHPQTYTSAYSCARSGATYCYCFFSLSCGRPSAFRFAEMPKYTALDSRPSWNRSTSRVLLPSLHVWYVSVVPP